MQILALDTSTAVAVGGRSCDGRTRSSSRERAGNAASERILPLIGEVLAEARHVAARRSTASPSARAPARSPACASRAASRRASRSAPICPSFGVPTLGAIAQSAWRDARLARVLACLDARMREVYVAAYRAKRRRMDARRRLRSCASPTTSPTPAVRGMAPATASPRIRRSRARLRLADVDATIIPDAQSVAEWRWPQLAAGEGVPAARGAAAVRAPPRRADDRRARRRAAPLAARRWPRCRSLRRSHRCAGVRSRAHDLPVVAALEARIHAAPWSERNFRDALAAGYSARVGVRARTHRRVWRADARPRRSAAAEPVRRARSAPQGTRPRAAAASSSTIARALGAEQLFLEVRVGNRAGDRALRSRRLRRRSRAASRTIRPPTRRRSARTRSSCAARWHAAASPPTP